jgi:hypothetical protein
MKLLKLSVFAIAVAGLVLVGAPKKAMACCTNVYEAWIILGLESSSGNVSLGTEVKACMKGVAVLRGRGFRLVDISQVRDNISVLYLRRVEGGPNGQGKAVSLFCYALINQFDEDSR